MDFYLKYKHELNIRKGGGGGLNYYRLLIFSKNIVAITTISDIIATHISSLRLLLYHELDHLTLISKHRVAKIHANKIILLFCIK